MAGRPLKFLTDQQVADIHEKLMARDGGLPGYREGASLAAVLGRVRNLIRFGGDSGACPERIAALVTFAITIAAPFNDGNRRTALACGLVVLGVNGRHVSLESAQLTRLIVSAGSGETPQEIFVRDYLALIGIAEQGSGSA